MIAETAFKIARELVDGVRGNARIDWTIKESVRAQSKPEEAAITVLEQAEVFCKDWAA